MKKLIPFLCLLLLLMNCQTEQLDINKDLAIDPEASVAFNDNAFPEQIFLPIGFSPEGIVNGNGTDFYVGSVLGGTIYKGDLKTGEGFILVPPVEGRFALGLDHDQRTDYLYVAGAGGVAYVYNATTGAMAAIITLNALSIPFTFVNDCIVTLDAVYFTDSFRDVYYRVALLNNGQLPDPIVVQEIQLTGDFVFLPWIPPGDPSTLTINGNGIVATPNEKNLIIGNSQTGLLYLVDPLTGVAQEIDLGGTALINDDGLVLQGKTLYVVQNFNNQISVVKLSSDYKSGEVVNVITNDEYKVPATATLFGSRLYAVNARFDVAPPPFLGGGPNNVLFDIIGVPAK
jgi:hypothetical protein